MELTKEYLHELFNYKNGELFWKVNRCRAKSGERAGRTKTNGYCEVRVDGKLHGTHRLIYLMHHGFLPKIIDHIDGNPSNNNLDNLREASHAENMRNSKIPTSNSSGFKGVYWCKTYKKWISVCAVDGKRRQIGSYVDIMEAANAVKEFRKKNHKEFSRHE